MSPIEMQEDSILALGYVTAYFSELELVVHAMAWQLLNLRTLEEGMEATSRMRMSRALKLVSRLVANSQADSETKKALRRFSREVKKAGISRARLLHLHWVEEDSPYTTRRVMDVAHQVLDACFLGRRTFDNLFGYNVHDSPFFSRRLPRERPIRPDLQAPQRG